MRYGILVLLLLSGCSKKSNPVQALTPDDELRAAIVGRWQNGGPSVVEFHSDGTFIDSSYETSSVDSSQVVLSDVISGMYSIQNSCITYDNYHIAYHSWPDAPGSFLWLSSSQITVNGDWFEGRLVEILNPAVAGQATLGGTWTEDLWVRTFTNQNQPYEGKARITHIFDPGTSTESQTLVFVNAVGIPGFQFSTSYSYVPPSLTESGTTFTGIVSAGKLYLYSPAAYDLVRVNGKATIASQINAHHSSPQPRRSYFLKKSSVMVR